jgi:NitT/TauT family transport system ATP-binding protein
MSAPPASAATPPTSGASGVPDLPIRLSHVDVEFLVPGTLDVNRAVADFSIDIRRGEFVVLVGRSGCGKTTILNLLAGLVTKARGEVDVMGKDPIEARPHIAYMFARDALLPWRSARRNVEFALELRRPELRREERRRRAGELLDMLGLHRAHKLWPWQLSQGMRQRVALARTWAIEPDIVLMDEPFAALDAQTRIDAQQIFLETWSRDQKTVVFVTHDLDEAILLGDRVIVMHTGRAVDEVVIDLPRPRNPLTLVEEPTYRPLHHRLVHALTTGVAAPAHEEAARTET